MRSVTLLFVALTVIAAIGLTPRPLITPDWRTPYEKALAAENCEALRRALDIQMITDNQPAWFEIVGTLEKKELCGAKRNPDTDYDFNEINFYKPWSFIHRARASSYIWPRIDLLLRKRPQTENPILKASVEHIRLAELKCRGHMAPALSYPDYRLMAYALDQDDLSAEEIAQIALDQKTVCASMLLGETVLMLNASKSAEDYATALSYGAYFAILGYAAPEMFSEIIRITNALPDTIKEDNEFNVHVILEYSLKRGFLQTEIGCNTAYENTLLGAISCADIAAEKIAEQPLTAAYAYYYALRAKRLGWENVADAEKIAQDVLTPECLADIATLEKEHIRESSDHRRYLILDQPYELIRFPACDYLQPDSRH